MESSRSTRAAALLPSIFIALILPAAAVDPVMLNLRFKDLPTVPEDELPGMDNRKTAFRGVIKHPGLKGNTWVAFPFVENPGSLTLDRKGRLYVAEVNRLWQGVLDLRQANEMIRDDFQSATVEDRLSLHEKYKANFPEGWFEKVADRIVRLEDRDGNGVADRRTLFSDRFRKPEDGIGFSLLADEDHTVYFTCIPHVWKLTDRDDDGVADSHEPIASGFGARISFIGHDLHGITRGPDGMLYFSIGDRGYHLKDGSEMIIEGRGTGAIFRCESDGTGLELFCQGLRNPQELVFDDFGNLFTFDNTGDIGDQARMVYALPGTDSGWNMAHQSAHHYATSLDWGEFRPEKSMWVSELMWKTHNEEQPQWVYPPASNVTRGPSGATWLTGLSIPENLRGKFLVTDYRGAPKNCLTVAIAPRPVGAGFQAGPVETVVEGTGASDVELGYDGKIYLCAFDGGWTISTNGSIQVLESTSAIQQKAGAEVAGLFAEGFSDRPGEELRKLLEHADRRVRFAAQFALVGRNGGTRILQSVAVSAPSLHARLHALWGLGEVQRKSPSTAAGKVLLKLIEDPEVEVRASAIRILGDNRHLAARGAILQRLESDDSPRVRSLAAIALGRVGPAGDEKAIAALYRAAARNGESDDMDVVMRHALLSGLTPIGTNAAAAARVNSESLEERLLAVLFLRRQASAALAGFLDDTSPLIRREVVRAIYETAAMDGPAGEILASRLEVGDFPRSIQRRVVAANYRLGKPVHASHLLKMAANAKLDPKVREAALLALLRWETILETDPVSGDYRPIPGANRRRTLATLGDAIGEGLAEFLKGDHPSRLVSLGIQLADATGIQLDQAILFSHARNGALDTEVRTAALRSLVDSKAPGVRKLIHALLDAGKPGVQAAALKLAFEMGGEDDSLKLRARSAIRSGPLPVARAAIAGMAARFPGRWIEIWKGDRENLRPELQLDAYLATKEASPELAAAFAKGSPNRIHDLSEFGGDPIRGEQVYLNQGACRQCHQINRQGGVQGPDLTNVARRLNRKQILLSIYDPSAVIAPGYGTSTVTLESGDLVVGRIADENAKQVSVIAPDGTTRVVPRSEIASITPPISTMPPLGATLPPRDLRDLVAYVAAQKGPAPVKEEGEEITK